MSWSGSKGRSKTLRGILRQLKSAKSSRLIELSDSRLKIAINYFFSIAIECLHCLLDELQIKVSGVLLAG